ncbi:MAG: acylglycerol kinase family protein [Deltaproteobacteria bacterium]|nr:acylglycerol kinase family protein [Deltaproteobacteria bacterium]MBW2070257.1 acylglycerol kinase family protein [Deltaproteobacteria bacterium]
MPRADRIRGSCRWHLSDANRYACKVDNVTNRPGTIDAVDRVATLAAPVEAAVSPQLAKGPLRVGVLSNPLSGGNSGGLEKVQRILAECPHAVHRTAHSPVGIAAALAELSREQVDMVAINGGDGTIQAVLTALFNQQLFDHFPLLAVLRAGTDSIIARDVGLRGSRDRALKVLLNWANTRAGHAELIQRTVMRLDGTGKRSPLYGFIFGAASIYQGILFCHRQVYRLGLHGEIAPSLTLVRFLLALASRGRNYLAAEPMRLRLDRGPATEQDYVFLLVTTLERLFLGMRPFWGEEKAPLHYTAVASQYRHLASALPAIIRGRKGRYGRADCGYFSHNVHEIELCFAGGFTVDGELYQPACSRRSIVIKEGGQVFFLQL